MRRLLFVGAFPPKHRKVFGGMVTACATILDSSLTSRVIVDQFDSTQISNPPPSLPFRMLLAMKRLVAFVWRCETKRPDVVLLFAAVGASLVEKGAMAWYCRARGIAVLLFPRGGSIIDICEKSPFKRRVVRIILGGANKMLCQGPAWQTFATEVCGYASGDAPIVRNWTATPEYLALGTRRELAGHGPVTLLFVGWLEESKGVYDLLDACARLLDRYNFSVVYVGDGNARPQLERRVVQIGACDRIRIAGWLNPDELRIHLSQSDIFVLPSHAEGLPNAMIEAMAAGLPVVVSSVGNIPDVVKNLQTGMLIPPRDVTALAAAIELLIAHPLQRDRIGKAGHRSAREAFGLEAAADRLVAIIEELPRRTTEAGSEDRV